MRINSLRVINYRNYVDQIFDFDPHIILIYGDNGQGKTNILEAIYTSAIGKSHRTSVDSEMIMFEKNAASITTDFISKDVPKKIFLQLSLEDRKKILFNDNKISQKELLGTLNIVLFSPEDLQIIKGSPKLRRNFLDLELSQVDSYYYQQFLKYQRILQQRNKILKEQQSKVIPSLNEWDIQLAESASYLIKKRLQSLEKINILLGLMHRKLTSSRENLHLIYKQSHEGNLLIEKEDIYYALQKNLEIDKKRMSTTIGPHRDDIIFISNNQDLKKFGSQGQQRTAILSLKLSELEFIKSEKGEYPVLLLDDVLSELDKKRQNNLLSFIHRRVQTFITTTNIDDYKNMKDVQFIEIKR